MFVTVSLAIICYVCSFKAQENIKHIVFCYDSKGVMVWGASERPGVTTCAADASNLPLGSAGS